MERLLVRRDGKGRRSHGSGLDLECNMTFESGVVPEDWK